MKRLILIAVAAVLLIGLIGTGTVVMAKNESLANSAAAMAGADNPGKLSKVQILRRLLLIQDEAKIDTLLAQAVASARITEDQAARIKTYWLNNHEKAARLVKGVIAKRILLVGDEAKLDSLIARGLANGKISQDQADKIKSFWQANHR